MTFESTGNFSLGDMVRCMNDTPVPGYHWGGQIKKGDTYKVIGFQSGDHGPCLVLDADPSWRYLEWRFRRVE